MNQTYQSELAVLQDYVALVRAGAIAPTDDNIPAKLQYALAFFCQLTVFGRAAFSTKIIPKNECTYVV